MSTVFTTESLERRERFDYWHEVVSKYYAPCLGLTDHRDGFNATTEVQALGSTELSSVVSDSIRYDRRDSDLRSIPREDIFISVMLDGEGYFTQNGREVRQSKGDVLVYDSAKPYSFNYTTAYKSRLLRIPRPLIQSKVDDLDCIGGTILNGSMPYGRLVGSLMNETAIIASSPELCEEDQFIIPTLDMITSAIQKSTQGISQAQQQATTHGKLLNEVKTYIRTHITDEDLTLEKVAQVKNISVRTLSRIFAEAGETPRNWLQAQRLSSAYDSIVNKRVTNITEAALTFGYKDLSHFSRTFKKQFGCSPKDLLR